MNKKGKKWSSKKFWVVLFLMKNIFNQHQKKKKNILKKVEMNYAHFIHTLKKDKKYFQIEGFKKG